MTSTNLKSTSTHTFRSIRSSISSCSDDNDSLEQTFCVCSQQLEGRKQSTGNATKTISSTRSTVSSYVPGMGMVEINTNSSTSIPLVIETRRTSHNQTRKTNSSSSYSPKRIPREAQVAAFFF
jgi:hypothetical protein